MFRASVAHASGASLVHCGNNLMTSARRCLKRTCHSSAVIAAPFVDSRLPCLTTAGGVAMGALAAGTTSTPTLSNGTVCPPGRVRKEGPMVASIFSPTCASVARRPRLMRLCEALSRKSTFCSLMFTTIPLSVRNGISTAHRYLGVVVPLAVTISVLFGSRLPFTASEMLVTQCIPAPVSPSHIVFAPEAAIAGIDCMTEVKIACVSVSPCTCAKWSLLKAVSPRVTSAMRMNKALHIANPCGKWRRTSPACASPRPRV
eukprot:3236281-Pleurochrysis_carterae.AAC.2